MVHQVAIKSTYRLINYCFCSIVSVSEGNQALIQNKYYLLCAKCGLNCSKFLNHVSYRLSFNWQLNFSVCKFYKITQRFPACYKIMAVLSFGFILSSGYEYLWICVEMPKQPSKQTVICHMGPEYISYYYCRFFKGTLDQFSRTFDIVVIIKNLYNEALLLTHQFPVF